MTCIVGYRAKGKVYIGGDRLASAGNSIDIRKQPKVFVKKEFAIGYTSSFRMGDILKYIFKIPPISKRMDEMKYMVTIFIPSLIKCLEKNRWLGVNEDVASGGVFLVGINGRLFTIFDDFQVAEEEEDYSAIGCGEDVAKGAMNILTSNILKNDKEIKNAIIRAIEAASTHCAWVGGGVDIVNV